MYKNYEKVLKKKKLTSYQVAKATGISQSILSDWKRGRSKPKIDKLIKIADFLGVDVRELIESEGL